MNQSPFGKGTFNYLVQGLASSFSGRAGKNRAAVLIGIIITLLMTGLMFFKPSPIEILEEKLLDFRFKARGPLKVPESVVIAAIDEKSIEKLGRWPWSRDVIARLVDRLTKAGAGVVVFDIIYSEHEKNDPLLAASIKEAGNVVLPIVFDFDKKATMPDNKSLPLFAFSSVAHPEMFDKYTPITAKKVLAPVPGILKEAMTIGQINIFPDNDGTLRWESLVIGYNGYLYPSVTLQAAAVYLGMPPDKVVLDATKGVQLGKRFIPTDTWGRTLINYYGPEQTFPHVSISDILEGAVKPELLSGKVVLIGATAVGIYDLRVTPFAPAMPGVEKHASVIASILDNRPLRCAPTAANMGILLATGLLLSILIPRFKALGASGIAGGFLFLVLSSGYFLFARQGLWINISYPSITVLLIFVSITSYNYAVEERYSKRIKAMFSSYVTERIVNELIKNPDMAKLGGERREITVLFSDVRGFTSFSEKHSPEEVVSILNEYLGEMTDIVFKWEGTLDKFIGDAILAFWGAPMKQENHAELAARCALHMVKRLEELQEKWQSEGKPVLDCGIGINTGDVLVGNIGAEGKKMDYTVIGDNVNLGSRVESLTRKYNAHILITEFTLSRLKDAIDSSKIAHVSVVGLEKVIVKGKEKPVEIYELTSLEHGSASEIREIEEDRAVVRLKEK